MSGDYRRLFDLAARVVVITGGAGILGRRFAAAFADFGAAVAVVDLDAAAAGRVAAEVADAYGARTIGVGCDVTDRASVDAMHERVRSALGPVDVLLNNAAGKSSSLDGFLAPLERYGDDTWREVMAVNVDGMFRVARAIGIDMAARGRGSIVQTASIYGVVAPDQRVYEGSDYLGRPISSPPVYSASKAAVVGLTRHLAAYWGAKGVRVNTLTPGGVQSGQNEIFQQKYGARVPLGRMARADEMTGAAIFLASDAASYVTGHNLVVDGGLTAW